MLRFVCCIDFSRNLPLCEIMNKKETILLKFADKIKQERQKLGLSQENFAELIGFHRTYIGMLERAERNITLTNVEKIAYALNIDLKNLLDFDDAAQQNAHNDTR